MTDGSTAVPTVTVPTRTISPTEVIVVGGGPAGLAAAIELGQRGISCVVVEPRAVIDATRPRAKTTSTRTMEHLRRWGIAERLRAAAPLPVSWSQDVIFADCLLGTEITRFPGAFGLLDRQRGLSAENGQQAPQPVVEGVLRAAVAELDTVTLLTGYRVIRLEQDGDEVRAVIEPTDQTGDTPTPPTVVRGQYLLGCDGSGGLTRRAIGSKYEGSSNDIPNLSILFRAPQLAERVTLDPAVQYWIINAQAAGLMGRLDLADTWWAIVQSVPADVESVDPIEMIRALLGGHEDLAIAVIATDPWNARMLLVDRYRNGRIFLVGDAAHLNPPWGGHGFNTCLGDAVNIGWKLAAVLRGWAGPSLLDSYEAERRPVAAQTIADAGAQEKLLAPSFVRATDGDAGPEDSRRRLAGALQDKQGEFSSAGLVLGYHYAGSPVVVDDGSAVPEHDPIAYHRSARPGARLPHLWLTDRDGDARQARSLTDEIGSGMTLLHGPGAPTGAFADAARALDVPLTTVAISPAAVATLGASLLLIRPDQHVAWRGENDSSARDIVAVATGRRPAAVADVDADAVADAVASSASASSSASRS